MGKERDKIKEIKSLKERKEFNTFWDFNKRLDYIYNALEELDGTKQYVKNELLKSIPTSLVATMESYFKSATTSIIDLDDVYRKNTEKYFNEKFKINYEYFDNLQRREITLGELVAHHLSFGNFDDLKLNFTKLLSKTDKPYDFLGSLTKFCPEDKDGDDEDNYSIEYISRSGEICKSIQELYSIRNIICHEIGEGLEIDEEKIETIFYDTTVFLNHCDAYFKYLLFSTSLEDEKRNAKIAKEKCIDKENKLKDLISKITSKSWRYYGIDINPKDFNIVYENWLRYTKSYLKMMYGEKIITTEIKQEFYDKKAEMIEDFTGSLEDNFDYIEYILAEEDEDENLKFLNDN